MTDYLGMAGWRERARKSPSYVVSRQVHRSAILRSSGRHRNPAISPLRRLLLQSSRHLHRSPPRPHFHYLERRF